MTPRNVIVIHDTEHDSSNDDAIFHAGLLTLVTSNDISFLTLIASGADPIKSNIAAKTQVLRYSETNPITLPSILTEFVPASTGMQDTSIMGFVPASTGMQDTSFTGFVPASTGMQDTSIMGFVPASTGMPCTTKLEERVSFFETEVYGGNGMVAELPEYLYEKSQKAGAILDDTAENIAKRITDGVIICAHAPGYAQFLKNMLAIGADFSNSIIIIQGATSNDQIASTYNEKDGWINSEDRDKYLGLFQKVCIHDRVIANKYFQLGLEELKLVGEAFVKQGYRQNAEDYVKEASYGERSINFIKTGALVASRQPFAIKRDLWVDSGPYSPMLPLLDNIFLDIASTCIYFTYTKFHDWIIDQLTLSVDKQVISEKDQIMTTIGIQELHDAIPDGLTERFITPLAYRVALMLYLARGGEIKTSSNEDIATFLRTHCVRTIYDPITLFFVHDILGTKESKAFNMIFKQNDQDFYILKDLQDITIDSLITLISPRK